MAISKAYVVTGMTCEHCAKSVSEHVGKVAGVSQVSVELEGGRVTVTSEAPVAEEAVRAAVEDAGYAFAGTAS